MTTIGFQDLFRVGLLWGAAGDTQGDLEAGLAGFLLDEFAFDEEHLPYMREIQVFVERALTPNTARFDAPMFTGGALDEVCLAAIAEQEFDIGLASVGWLPCEAEVVVRLALFDQVSRELALGVQGIGGDLAPGHLDRLQQWDHHADLVGALFAPRGPLRGGCRLFLGVADGGRMPHDAHHVGLLALWVDGVAHRLAVDG